MSADIIPTTIPRPHRRGRRTRRPGSRHVWFTLLLLPLVLTACREPTLVTDALTYTEGEAGVATLLNPHPYAIYLEGCNAYTYQKQVGEEWVAQPPDFVCVWEGFARPVDADSALPLEFTARDAGLWRLWARVGAGCDPEKPMSEANCSRISDVYSNEFEVLADDPSCQVSGCSGQVCADHPVFTTCEWLPHYVCYRDARCGAFDHSTYPPSCGWEQTPELLRCLREHDAPPSEVVDPSAPAKAAGE